MAAHEARTEAAIDAAFARLQHRVGRQQQGRPSASGGGACQAAGSVLGEADAAGAAGAAVGGGEPLPEPAAATAAVPAAMAAAAAAAGGEPVPEPAAAAAEADECSSPCSMSSYHAAAQAAACLLSALAVADSSALPPGQAGEEGGAPAASTTRPATGRAAAHPQPELSSLLNVGPAGGGGSLPRGARLPSAGGSGSGTAPGRRGTSASARQPAPRAAPGSAGGASTASAAAAGRLSRTSSGQQRPGSGSGSGSGKGQLDARMRQAVQGAMVAPCSKLFHPCPPLATLPAAVQARMADLARSQADTLKAEGPRRGGQTAGQAAVARGAVFRQP
jgi:hypothetical protein